jgi:hypothetical protein
VLNGGFGTAFLAKGVCDLMDYVAYVRRDGSSQQTTRSDESI